MSFLAIIEILNFEILFWDLKMAQFTKYQYSEPVKWAKLTFLDRLNSQKFDFA